MKLPKFSYITLSLIFTLILGYTFVVYANFSWDPAADSPTWYGPNNTGFTSATGTVTFDLDFSSGFICPSVIPTAPTPPIGIIGGGGGSAGGSTSK